MLAEAVCRAAKVKIKMKIWDPEGWTSLIGNDCNSKRRLYGVSTCNNGHMVIESSNHRAFVIANLEAIHSMEARSLSCQAAGVGNGGVPKVAM